MYIPLVCPLRWEIDLDRFGVRSMTFPTREAFGSCVTLCFASPRFGKTLVVDMDVHDERAHRGAARRCRERRLRAFLRHEKLAVAMQMATVSHHSWHRAGRAGAGMQTVTYAAPAPVDEYITPNLAVFAASAPPPAATCAATPAPAPVIENVAPVPAVTYARLATVFTWHLHLLSPMQHQRQ